MTGGSARSQSNGYRLAEPNIEVQVDGPGVVTMTISLETVVAKYLDAKKLSGGTRKEYKSTIAKWLAWEGRVDVDKIERAHIREFLDWVHEKAIEGGGSNPGRTANKASTPERSSSLSGFMSRYCGGTCLGGQSHPTVKAKTLPQPTAFNALLHGFEGECPCCRRKFRQA